MRYLKNKIFSEKKNWKCGLKFAETSLVDMAKRRFVAKFGKEALHDHKAEETI